MQKICDNLTTHGVHKIAQQSSTLVKSICPSFLKCKHRAANVSNHLITKDLCRLLINFGLINQLIKNIPLPIVTIEDLYIKQGRLKEIIVLYLHSAFYQNHMHPKSQSYLVIMTLCRRLRVLARSRQGLLGRANSLMSCSVKFSRTN